METIVILLLFQVLTLHHVFSYPAGGYVLTYVPLDDFSCVRQSDIQYLPLVQCESYTPNQCDSVINIEGTTYKVGSCCPRTCKKKVYWDCPTYTMPLTPSFPAAAVLPQAITTGPATFTTVTYLPPTTECTSSPAVITGPATCATECAPLPTVTVLPSAPATPVTVLPSAPATLSVCVSSPCDSVVVPPSTCNTGPVLFPTVETEALILEGALPDLAPSVEALSFTTPLPSPAAVINELNYEVYEIIDDVEIENAVINPVIGSVSISDPRSKRFSGYVPGSGRVSINAHFI